MEIVKLSSKNQIVIPRQVRRELSVGAGDRLRVYKLDDGRAIIAKVVAEHTSTLRGVGKDVWEKLGGTRKYIKQERSSWGK